jgi:hypothetical protein
MARRRKPEQAALSQLQSSPDPNGPFAQAISHIGQALKRGDLTEAQHALSPCEEIVVFVSDTHLVSEIIGGSARWWGALRR